LSVCAVAGQTIVASAQRESWMWSSAAPGSNKSVATFSPVSPSSVVAPTKRNAASVATARTRCPRCTSREMASQAL